MPSITVAWKRAVRFVAKEDGKEHFGEPVDPELDVGLATYEQREVKVKEIVANSLLDLDATLSDKVYTVERLLCPLRQNEVGSIRCIGLNYRAHAKEANAAFPNQPVLFLKPNTSLSGPWPDPLHVPKASVDIDQVDYESELVFVLGKTAKDVSEEEAMDYVLAYASSNDVSFRKWQNGVTSQWCFGKGVDYAAPVGPCLVSTQGISDYTQLELTGKRNGKVVQSTKLDDLIFSIPKLIAFLSQGTTLPAGTVVMSGTPSGIGLFSNNLLQKGDVFTVHVSGGCGSLINVVTHEA